MGTYGSNNLGILNNIEGNHGFGSDDTLMKDDDQSGIFNNEESDV